MTTRWSTRRFLLALALAGGPCLSLVASAQAREPPAQAPPSSLDPPAPPAPPAYAGLRFEEDWSPFLCVPACARSDVLDRLKALRLSRDGSIWMSLGGQGRLRAEHVRRPAFGALGSEDAWLLARLRVHADLHVGPWARVFAEGIWAGAQGRDGGPRPVDENRGDLLNAFVDVTPPGLGPWEPRLRAGRQELLYDEQRLVGPLDWANTRRTFQGMSARVQTPLGRLDALVLRPVVVDADDLDGWDEDVLFAGLHLASRPNPHLAWSLYAWWLARDSATWLGTTDEDRRLTFGGFARGAFPGSRFDYVVEGAVQVGSFGKADVLAGMASAEVGWRAPVLRCWEPRLALGLDWASGDGDGDASGGRLGTFDQLFPTGHLFFGWADLQGRQNVLAGRLTATLKPAKALTLRADLHVLGRASIEDAVYHAGGGVLRSPGASSARHVATELDLAAVWTIDRHWRAEAGWSHVFPGRFLEETGAHADHDFLYAALTLTF